MRLLTSLVVLLCLYSCVISAATSYTRPIPRPQIRVAGGGPRAPPTGESGPAKRTASLQSLSPQQIMSCYNVTYSPTAGTAKTIAVIDSYGCSTCELDLGNFTTLWGLPACTTANGCFKKVNQTGGTQFPPDDEVGNWGIEAAMDIQAAHAMAPGAHKVLVVANSNSWEDLVAAVVYATTVLHANYISMSWGGDEWSTAQELDTYFNRTGTTYFASSGDNGTYTGILYPAASSKVIAVGGTSLYTNNGAFSSENGWIGSGGGCSAYTPAISAQSSKANYPSQGCAGKKALPDVSYLADPNSGMWVYFSGLLDGSACTPPACWYTGGGTSLAAPLVAGRAAARGIFPTAASVYTGGYTFRDIKVGNNHGHNCTTGMDLVTGQGSLLY